MGKPEDEDADEEKPEDEKAEDDKPEDEEEDKPEDEDKPKGEKPGDAAAPEESAADEKEVDKTEKEIDEALKEEIDGEDQKAHRPSTLRDIAVAIRSGENVGHAILAALSCGLHKIPHKEGEDGEKPKE